MGQQDSIVVFRNIIQALAVLPAELYKSVSEIVYAYAFDDVEPSEDTDPATMALFLSFKPQLDYNKERYGSYVARGKKGGAPRGNNNAKKKQANEVAEQAETSKNNLKQAKTTYDNIEQANEVAEQAETSKNNHISISISNNSVVVDDNSAHTRESENEKFLSEFFADNKRAQIEVLCMQLKATPQQLQEEAREIIAEWELTETTHSNYKEQARHLINQLRIKNNAKLREASNGTASRKQTGTAAQKGGYSEICTDTPPKKRRKSTI